MVKVPSMNEVQNSIMEDAGKGLLGGLGSGLGKRAMGDFGQIIGAVLTGSMMSDPHGRVVTQVETQEVIRRRLSP